MTDKVEYISVKNLDKYQPHYRDNRNVLWIRWDINAVRDYKIAKLSINQKWLFVCLICLACSNKNKIPADIQWLSEEVKIPEKSILNDLSMLQSLELVVTNCNKLLQDVTNVHLQTDIQTDIQTDNSGVSDFFNYYLLKTKKKFLLTPTNRKLILDRLSGRFTVDQLKQAVDNFVQDDWKDRSKHLDLIYCIGKQNGKPDNLEKWLNYTPKKEVKYG